MDPYRAIPSMGNPEVLQYAPVGYKMSVTGSSRGPSRDSGRFSVDGNDSKIPSSPKTFAEKSPKPPKKDCSERRSGGPSF